MTDSQDPAPDTAPPLRTGALLLDMDGTLLNGSDAVPDSFWELLPELRRRGITEEQVGQMTVGNPARLFG